MAGFASVHADALGQTYTRWACRAGATSHVGMGCRRETADASGRSASVAYRMWAPKAGPALGKLFRDDHEADLADAARSIRHWRGTRPPEQRAGPIARMVCARGAVAT